MVMHTVTNCTVNGCITKFDARMRKTIGEHRRDDAGERCADDGDGNGYHIVREDLSVSQHIAVAIQRKHLRPKLETAAAQIHRRDQGIDNDEIEREQADEEIAGQHDAADHQIDPFARGAADGSSSSVRITGNFGSFHIHASLKQSGVRLDAPCDAIKEQDRKNAHSGLADRDG